MRTLSLFAVSALSFAMGFGCAGPTPPAAAAPPNSNARAAEATASTMPKSAAPLAPMPIPETADPELQRLVGSVLVGGRALAYLRELSESHGPRLTGSPVLAGAARWAVAAFQRAGIDNAKIEEFTIPNGWERREARARILSPVERPLRVAASGWSTPTPAGGVRGQVLLVNDLEETMALPPEQLRGKILFISHQGFARGKNGALTRAVGPLQKAGVVAVLQHQARDNHAIRTHAAPRAPQFVSPLPWGDITLEDGAALERALEKGPVTLEFVNTSPISGPVKVPNVVAEIRGSERPDEIVIVGGHLDAWDLGTGAQDNGSGVASVLETARAIRALGRAPRRTIRFALWGGEEQGLLGSRAYVKAHGAELDRVVAVLNTDHGAGVPKGWIADGRPDVVKRFEPVAKATLSSLSGDALSAQVECDTDHCPFMLAGIPTLNLVVDTAHYGEVHHQSSDTLDKVAPGAFAASTAVVALTTFIVADSKERLGPRLDHAKVTAKLKEDKALFDALVFSGVFTP